MGTIRAWKQNSVLLECVLIGLYLGEIEETKQKRRNKKC